MFPGRIGHSNEAGRIYDRPRLLALDCRRNLSCIHDVHLLPREEREFQASPFANSSKCSAERSRCAGYQETPSPGGQCADPREARRVEAALSSPPAWAVQDGVL